MQRPQIFLKEYIGEELLNFSVSYLDMKSKYPTQVFDLGHQVDDIFLEKIKINKEQKNHPANAKLFVILSRHRQFHDIRGKQNHKK